MKLLLNNSILGDNIFFGVIYKGGGGGVGNTIKFYLPKQWIMRKYCQVKNYFVGSNQYNLNILTDFGKNNEVVSPLTS